MKNLILGCLLAFAVVLPTVGGDDGGSEPKIPSPRMIETGLYDMSERWQAMFGLDGKLEISNARKDLTPMEYDGPISLHFDAKPTVPGLYAFTFILLDGRGAVVTVKRIRVQVVKAEGDPKTAAISPAGKQSNEIGAKANFNDTLAVSWNWSPALDLPGAGPGGWQLLSTAYAEKDPLSVPGYEHVTGE